MVFGNAYAEFDLGNAERMVADELYALSERLGKASPDNQAHGLLGGTWGYGQDFENEVFEMHPYWWGDCECGHEQAECEWSEANPHRPDCWQERYHAEAERLRDLDWEKQRDQMDKWASDNGWNGRPGVAVYCDCGTDKLWREWASAHGHDPSCRIVMPNFRCGAVEVRWYKYIGRGMSVNREVSRSEWRDIFARCEESLSGL